MYVRCNTKHRNTPVKCINKSFNNIACPFFRHTSILSQYFYRLKYCNTLVYFGLIMSKIQTVADTLFVCIEKNLSFLFQIRNKFIKKSSELKSVNNHVNAVRFDNIPQRFLCILKSQLILFFLFQLCSAERTTYNQAGTSVCFPLAATLFTLHCISPPSFGIPL